MTRKERQHGRVEGGPGEEENGIEHSSPDEGGDHGWTREDMEHAEPYPMPEVPDGQGPDEGHDHD